MSKLPYITSSFWLMKITATTLGETGGDWLSMTMNAGYLVSTLVFFALFAIALGAQLLSRKYRPFLYWTVIVATSTAGTTMSDYMDRTLGLGYATGAAILVSILIVMLALWKFAVGNVSVNDIRTRKAEIFYWITILFSNTLGTALGDFLADDSGLGFFGSWLLISAALGLILAANYFTRIPKVLLFWLAFILSRPFGATFGDVLTKSSEKGGLDLGTGNSSIILLATLLISILVFYPKIKA
ncbi:MAG: COG4705 family protein [Bdellovibrionales bacterium]